MSLSGSCGVVGFAPARQLEYARAICWKLSQSWLMQCYLGVLCVSGGMVQVETLKLEH